MSNTKGAVSAKATANPKQSARPRRKASGTGTATPHDVAGSRSIGSLQVNKPLTISSARPAARRPRTEGIDTQMRTARLSRGLGALLAITVAAVLLAIVSPADKVKLVVAFVAGAFVWAGSWGIYHE